MPGHMKASRLEKRRMEGTGVRLGHQSAEALRSRIRPECHLEAAVSKNRRLKEGASKQSVILHAYPTYGEQERAG